MPKIPVPKCLRAENTPCWNVSVPKIPRAEKSSCRKCARDGMSRSVQDAEIYRCRNVWVPKIPRAENFPCRKFPASKCSRVETSIRRDVRGAERWTCRNRPVMKYPCRNVSCRKVPCRNNLQWILHGALSWHAKITLLNQVGLLIIQTRPLGCARLWQIKIVS